MRNRVWPSGSARATVSAATTPPAPGRFSTVTGWPSDRLISAATMRAVRSPTPPAANGTTMRRVLLGKPWAMAGETSASAEADKTAPSRPRRRKTRGKVMKVSCCRWCQGKTTVATRKKACNSVQALSGMPKCMNAGRSASEPQHEQRDTGEKDQDHRADEVAGHEGHDRAVGLRDRGVARHRVDDEQVHAHRRRDQPHLHHDQHQDAEPDG